MRLDRRLLHLLHLLVLHLLLLHLLVLMLLSLSLLLSLLLLLLLPLLLLPLLLPLPLPLLCCFYFYQTCRMLFEKFWPAMCAVRWCQKITSPALPWRSTGTVSPRTASSSCLQRPRESFDTLWLLRRRNTVMQYLPSPPWVRG